MPGQRSPVQQWRRAPGLGTRTTSLLIDGHQLQLALFFLLVQNSATTSLAVSDSESTESVVPSIAALSTESQQDLPLRDIILNVL